MQAISVDQLNTVYFYSIFHRSVSGILIGSLCFSAKAAVGLGSLVTSNMSEWLVECSNTHQPPILHSRQPSVPRAHITSKLVI